jgi:hypothetical protein
LEKQAKKELDAHINEHSDERAKANAAALAEETERKKRELEQRRRNGRGRLEFHRSQWHSHCREASKHIDQYLQLKRQLGEEEE